MSNDTYRSLNAIVAQPKFDIWS